MDADANLHERRYQALRERLASKVGLAASSSDDELLDAVDLLEIIAKGRRLQLQRARCLLKSLQHTHAN
jgi:hypothetical protein